VQSLCLYSAVARLPVALALLAFNTYPIWTALWAWVVYRQRPERAVLMAMPVMLVGLALALDVLGAASGLGAAGQWGRIGAGVAFALAAAGTFGAGAGADAARGRRPGRPRAHRHHHGHGGPAGAGHRGRTRAAFICPRPCRLGRAGRADLPVRHGLHHHVHRAAASWAWWATAPS
jgi:hypothetical protein